jgi:hypothetical protein
MDGISPRRAFELRDLGHELLALALRGSILEGDEAGRVMVALATVSAFTSAVAAMLSFMLSSMRCLTAAAHDKQRGELKEVPMPVSRRHHVPCSHIFPMSPMGRLH